MIRMQMQPLSSGRVAVMRGGELGVLCMEGVIKAAANNSQEGRIIWRPQNRPLKGEPRRLV